jgi:hypothetical protein
MCNPNQDTVCAPNGYACDRMFDDAGMPYGTCQIPGFQQACLPSVGCVSDYSCVASQGSICIQNCQTTLDCSNPYFGCVAQVVSSTQGGCLPTPCGPFPDGGGNGSGVYLPCTAYSGDDGTCEPLGSVGDNCAQAGPVGLFEECTSDRIDGGTSSNCAFGSICQYYPQNNDAGICLSLCAVHAPTLPDGGPGCASNQTCLQLTPSMGECRQTCGPDAGCPSPLICQVGLTGGMECEPP